MELGLVKIPTHQQISLLEVQLGGIENIGCTTKDIYNYDRDKREELKGHDGDILYAHFLLQQEKNPFFTFKIVEDSEKRIKHCFWADATSRRAYSLFGDVVIFDTTYNTNKYRLIFAPLLGINHHEAMLGGSLPKMIITDQDPAMKIAIAQVLPNTFHRSCVWNSEMLEEFDNKWKEVVERSGLSDNGWLQAIYDIRASWVPAYYFVIRFNRGLVHQRHQELVSTHTDLNQEPQLQTPHPMESQMAGIYTRACFHEFQSEYYISSFNYRHILGYLLKVQEVDQLPDQYILKRWTKAANADVVKDLDGLEITNTNGLVVKRSKLFHHASLVIDKVLTSPDEAQTIFIEALDNVLDKLKQMQVSSSESEKIGKKLPTDLQHSPFLDKSKDEESGSFDEEEASSSYDEDDEN
ncbi:PREDICTED: protein FAR1-RELATED SEQUENCE 5-like [Fragaria vesca subsp. vesca]